MPNGPQPAAAYFKLFALAKANKGSTTNELHNLADIAIAGIKRSDTFGALAALRGLKQCFDALQPTLDDDGQTQHNDTIEIMVLRKQMLEAKLESALLLEDKVAAEELRLAIGSVDQFFANAISDLDPDRT